MPKHDASFFGFPETFLEPRSELGCIDSQQHQWRHPMLESGFARVACLAALVGAAAPALAQETILSETFEGGTANGWETNGGEVLSGGNPGNQLHVLYMDWDWITLRNSEAGSPVVGDL